MRPSPRLQYLQIAAMLITAMPLACEEASQNATLYRSLPVERRDIVVVVEAAGILEILIPEIRNEILTHG